MILAMNSLLDDIRAVVFDAVGTLLHPEPPAPAVYAEVGHRFGSRLDTAAIARRFRTALAREDLIDQENGLRTSEAREIERWRRIVLGVLDGVTDPEGCFQELFEHFSRPEAWRTEPDAAVVLAGLANRGYALAMASNYDRRLRSVVAGMSELAPLQHLIISSEVGWRKPAPEFFAALCRIMDLPAEEILYVGDDPANDYEGGRMAKLKVLLFDRAEKTGVLPRANIRCLTELLE
jgi:putative hydrolase of the HAD superfamily